MSEPQTLQLHVEQQRNPVADEVSALVAVVRPILEGILWAVKGDIVAQLGGHEEVSLEMLARVYKPGDGDCGICFEWALHDAMNRAESRVLERVTEAMSRFCKVPGKEPASILFGAEKTGALKLIDTAKDRLTDDSRILVGKTGQPPKLKSYMSTLAAAFRRPEVRKWLPYSISGLWKADLFVGNTDSDRWIGSTVKINPHQLEGARGLRLGIVPCTQGASDKIHKDETKNLVVCPIPYDGAFMEMFYRGWTIVRQFISADAKMPREAALPLPAERHVAKQLVERKTFKVVEVVDALRSMSQPELLETTRSNVDLTAERDAASILGAVLAPKPSSTT